MREDRPSFLFTKFANPARPFANACPGGIAELYGRDHLADMGQKKFPNPLL